MKNREWSMNDSLFFVCFSLHQTPPKKRAVVVAFLSSSPHFRQSVTPVTYVRAGNGKKRGRRRLICFLGAEFDFYRLLSFHPIGHRLSLSPGVETTEGAATRGHMCVRVCGREREITVSKMTNASSMLSPFAASDAKLLYYSRRLSRSPHLISSASLTSCWRESPEQKTPWERKKPFRDLF